jgi:DNA-binding NtrC family response regulator
VVTLGECFLNPIHGFTHPKEFLRVLPELDLGLVVTDFNMPDIDGIELMTRVQRHRPGLPFLIITGHVGELESRNLAQFRELRGILPKPFGWRKLAAEILRVGPASPRL